MIRKVQIFLKKPVAMALLFVLFVIIPGVVLSLIGLRSLSRENAFLEKQISSALALEAKPLVSVMGKELNAIKVDLDTIFTSFNGIFVFDSSLGIAAREGYDWMVEQSNLSVLISPYALIEMYFALDDQGSIITPGYREGYNEESQDFFRFNREFFENKVPVPVYKNVIQNAKAVPTKRTVSQKNEIENGVSHRTAGKSSAKESSYEVITKEYLRFSQIVGNQNSGMILRELDGVLMLLYFHKTGDGTIHGAVVSLAEVEKRLSAHLPETENSQRLLCITNQNDEPFVHKGEPSPEGEPLVELSLGSYLPVWHLASYLSDPMMIEQKAFTNGVVIGLMILLLLVSLTIGGYTIIRSILVQLREAEQKTTFVANVSHELKTPLTSIRLFSELLQQERQPEPEKQKKYLSIMVSESERLTRLINNVLDFSRGSKGERQYHKREIDFALLVAELIELQQVRLEHKKFTVETAIPSEPIVSVVDSEAIKQVVLNLLSNAEKYSLTEKWIRVSVTSSSDGVELVVEDRGIGIEPSLRKKVFEEFYRIDTSLTTPVPGTGLGLTITQRIVKDHGGTISCDAGDPVGTKFTVFLPKQTEKGASDV